MSSQSKNVPNSGTNKTLSPLTHNILNENKEKRDVIMAKRIKDSEVIGNKPNLNPLQAPFAYIDGSVSLDDEIQVIINNLRNLLNSKNKLIDDSGIEESTIDKKRMKNIEKKINKLKILENERKTSIENELDNIFSLNSRSNSNAIVDSENKENKLIQALNYESEPVSLPNRNSTWKHSNKEYYLENYLLRKNNLFNLNISNNDVNNNNNNNIDNLDKINYQKNIQNLKNSIKLDLNDPQSILDIKNDEKTSYIVDSFLLGYADMLFLTSSYFKDENGNKRDSLMVPLLSLCLTDITYDVFLSRHKSKQTNDINNNNSHNNYNNYINSLNSNIVLNNEESMKMAIFAKNRIFRIHLEYGIGTHVLRWDLEKDTRSLLDLHKKLQKRNTKERIDITKKKDIELPRFPVFPNRNTKFKGLFKGDREIFYSNDNNIESSKHTKDHIPNNENLTDDPKHNLTQKTNNNNNTNNDINSNIVKSLNNNTDNDNNNPNNNPNNNLSSTSLERCTTNNSTISTPSVTHTLTRFSTAIFNNLLSNKDKSTEKRKEKERDKPKSKDQIKSEKLKLAERERERLLMAIRERSKLNQSYKDEMQKYFDSLIEIVSFKEQAFKLLQFFELSPFSLLLSNEIYKKRKEGYLFIVSSAKTQGWRVSHFRFHDLSEMIKRHTSKWCIIGDSFLMYTSDISSTTPEEIFLIDSKTTLKIKGFDKSNRKYGNINNISNEDANQEYFQFPLDVDEENIDYDHEDNDYFETSNSVLKNAKSYPTIKLINNERSIKLVAKNPKITMHWALALKNIINETEWAKSHRFDSFAPIRKNCFAQWFVDARDYWYAASCAIEMAKDVIYIHDWWLSPELYLRRPANGNQNWRIDRLLEKKAREGIKIFVIIYRNVGNTVVTDSMYTKHSLLDLHENIYVLRSPNQIMQNVFFWAHHEKLLIIDNAISFLGGIDLCFGRYDTPDHVLVDDNKHAFESFKSKDTTSIEEKNEKSTFSSPSSNDNSNPNSNSNIDSHKSPTSSNNLNDDFSNIDSSFQEQFQVFPGKDYSNPRKKDFFELTLPHNDMYDRQYVPRMPWHDVHMVTAGEVARDLSRHFIQRWNYLLRQKRPSRPTPLLVPPRPFTEEELNNLKLKGTCEVQLLRSSCEWSLGLTEHEQSIQNAYIKCIEQSEHFIYIENQFFITSCTIDNCIIKNQIGDALVDRIITAHKNGEVWKAVIIIPLMPGFEADVDTKEGGSVRLIMQCQYMSISMGETSIFARLRRIGIRPEEYIHFYSLRKWGLIGEKKLLTTEQLYIHAKTMIVDDRIAIIGSANINERSMRGTRDSEICAIVRDEDMIESKMDGKTYHVGKFAHGLRVRLMREHMGVDVDLLDLVERRFHEIETFCKTEKGLKASVLKHGEGKQYLSSMVEMGTRYLLGIDDGTPGFNKRLLMKDTRDKDDEINAYKNQLTHEMISTFKNIRNEMDESDALDDIEFSYSFNHRAGDENVGIRSAKNLSSDIRVTNDNHRSEVKGDFDGFNSKDFSKAKFEINRFLVSKVNKFNYQNSNDPSAQLPDFEDIVDVLAQDIIENASAQDQDAINIDRWTIIKRLFYMRKLYFKMASNKESISTNPKNVDILASGVGLNSAFSNTDKSFITKHNSNTTSENDSVPSEGLLNSTDDKNTTLPDIPLIKLTNDDFNDIDKNLLPSIECDFIDPYGFEDPLDIKFYEGTWMTQAIRNTLLFQMVFHVQPDDIVQTWRDYKDFEEMKSAFTTYQNIYRGNLNSTESMLLKSRSNETINTNDNNFTDEDYDTSIGDVEEHRRRLQRSAKLTELERYIRIGGQTSVNVAGANGYSRGAVYDYASSLRLMHMIRGHLVMFPTRWLKKEVEGSNWFYKADKIPPIQIYN